MTEQFSDAKPLSSANKALGALTALFDVPRLPTVRYRFLGPAAMRVQIIRGAYHILAITSADVYCGNYVICCLDDAEAPLGGLWRLGRIQLQTRHYVQDQFDPVTDTELLE